MADKTLFVGAHVKPGMAGALREIAKMETESNLSMALRKVLREAAERRGLVVLESKNAGKGEVSNV